MKILHYSLGFPPYRSGGLTKFCMDLMKQQCKDKNEVALLWPGRMGVLNKKVSIKHGGFYTSGAIKIKSYEVINPIPVPFDEGISEFDKFIVEGETNIFADMLNEFKPSVIHIHTLMGLHKAFIMAANEKGIRVVYTAHDFFPICPKVTMFRHGTICRTVANCSECGTCNVTALDIRKIQILQSTLYRRLKDSAIIKKIRKHHRDNYLSESTAIINGESVGDADDYKRLRMHYKSMIDLIDIIHYNSSVTKEVYERFLGKHTNTVIGITHDNIADNRKIKNFNDEKIRMRYLGPYGGAKGFFISRRLLTNFGMNNRISS